MDPLPAPGATAAIRFHFDIGSPYAYLAAERIDALMPAPVTWSPVLLGGVYKQTGRVSWATTPRRDDGVREIERRAAAYGLPPLVWPEVMPGDGLLAMRVAVAADECGAGREFARAAFRLQFAEGRAISDPAVLGLAAERAGLAADALLAAAVEPGVKARLRALTDAALTAGVVGVPTVEVGIGDPPHPLHWGDDRLEAAAADALRRFARAWIAAWNAHDLDAIMAHYREDVRFRSPLVRRIAGEPGGELRGVEALRAYFRAGLAAFPELRFTLESVHQGVDGVSLVYTGVGGRRVVESVTLDAAGRIGRASVAYEPAP